MKTVLLMVLLCGTCGLAGAFDDKKAGDKKVDAVGTWKCEYDISGNKRTATLTIKKDGDKLVGTMNWADQKDEKLKDVKLTDKELSFSAVRKFMGNEISIIYKLTIDGDQLKGKGSSDFGGQKQVFDLSGKREKKEEKKGEQKSDKSV